MPLRELRVSNFRPFADSGLVRMAPCSAIVGRNDVGKSGLLAAVNLFFNPPKKGLPIRDIHLCDQNKTSAIELAFNPEGLGRNAITTEDFGGLHLIQDHLVDASGLLRLRVNISNKRVEAFEIFLDHLDDLLQTPVAFRSEDQIEEMLKALGHPFDKTLNHAQKRALLRQVATNKGVKISQRWYDASKVEDEIRGILPGFMYFTDTSNYAISQTDVQNQFRGVVDKAIAAHPLAGVIEDEIRDLVQREFNKVFTLLSNLTDAVTALTATPRVSWKKAMDGVDLRWQDQNGFEAPFELRGAGIRRLFMVAYFQYEAAASLYDPNGRKYVFAIEEPEVHLHPGAQRALLEAFTGLSKRGHSVIFATHSPVFAGSTPLAGITLVKRNTNDSETVQAPNLDLEVVA